MVDLIKRTEDNIISYIITIENPDYIENGLIDHAHNIIEYNNQRGVIPNQTPYLQEEIVQSNDETTYEKNTIEMAQKIIDNYKFVGELTTSIRAQIINDIRDGKDLSHVIILSSEIISRLIGNGDKFANQVIRLLEERKRQSNENT